MSRIQPALSDARCFTSWLSSCAYDQTLQNKYKTPSDASFRSFLQHNALLAQDETRKMEVWRCAYPFMIPVDPKAPAGPSARIVRPGVSYMNV